jgi:hypothetical protein
MATQTSETTKYEVRIGEEKGRFDCYTFGQLVTKTEFEAEFAGAGNEACDFAWTSDTEAEWYSYDVMSQEDGSEAKEWIHYIAILEEAPTLLNELENYVGYWLEMARDSVGGDYDEEEWGSICVEVFDDSFFFVTEDGTYGSVKGLQIVPAGHPSVPAEDADGTVPLDDSGQDTLSPECIEESEAFERGPVNVWLVLDHSAVSVCVDLPDDFDEDDADRHVEVKERALEIVADDLDKSPEALASCIRELYTED